MKKIICLSGKQYSGKDALAKIMLQDMPDFKRMAIADAIKAEFARRNNLTTSFIEENKGKYRTGLIELGNEGRKIDPDFWLNKIIDAPHNVIVTDLRLIHEADVFKKAGAILIRVEAPFETRSKRGIITNAKDSTEVELDNYTGFDYIINNDKDFEALKTEAKKLLLFLKNKK